MSRIDYIIEQQNQTEKVVFQRSLRQMMLEDYLVTNEMKEQLDNNSYQFPSYKSEWDTTPPKIQQNTLIPHSLKGNAYQILIRSQNYFSVKIHYIDTDMYFHKHDFVELIYVYRGRCTHYIEDVLHKKVLEENEMILVNQNVTHAIGKISKEDVILKMVLPVSFLQQDFPYQCIGNKTVSNFFSTALKTTNCYYGYLLFRNKNTNDVKAYMEKILIEYFEQKPCYLTVIKSLLGLLFIEMMRKELAQELRLYQLSSETIPVCEILFDIENHCNELSLHILAKKYGYNESYLSRMIHKITGQSFLQLLAESRCKKAIYLLKESDLPIELIAEQCGYNNVNNLYRLVKKKTGKSPMEIRMEL